MTYNQTPTSEAIAAFVKEQALTVVTTEVWRRYQHRLADTATGSGVPPRKVGLGELAIQEYMTRLGLEEPVVPAVFLFEDHKIARASFHLPDSVTESPPGLTSTFGGKGLDCLDEGDRASCYPEWPPLFADSFSVTSITRSLNEAQLGGRNRPSGRIPPNAFQLIRLIRRITLR